jgi:hypothetical protein
VPFKLPTAAPLPEQRGRAHVGRWESVSTMYRVLHEHDEVRERRRQATDPAAKKPELLATEPNPGRELGHLQAARPGQVDLLPVRDGLVELSLTFSAGGRADAHASRRDLERAIGACGTAWCRRRAGHTLGGRNAATGRGPARGAPR